MLRVTLGIPLSDLIPYISVFQPFRMNCKVNLAHNIRALEIARLTVFCETR